MIVQAAPGGSAAVVIAQREHTRLAAEFARSFGNDHFAPLQPRELMEFVADNHDRGWDAVDEHMSTDPDTGLPYSLIKTPLELLLETGPGSPDFCEAHHPWCGLLVSMHTYGLYNGRYGLSDKIVVNTLPPEQRGPIEAMLSHELERQNRLTRELAASPDTAELASERLLLHNYKLLQFFDTLSLYFNMSVDEQRGEARFANVPMAVGEDVTVTVRRVEPGVYSLAPYPFAEQPLVVQMDGRRVEPRPGERDWAEPLASAPMVREIITLVAAS